MVMDECPKKVMIIKKLKNQWNYQCIGLKDQKKHLVKILNKAIFGIIQGGLFKDLRIKSLEKLLNIDFDGYAVGGLAVGESQNEMFKVLDYITNLMPKNKPRYLMGVGTPSDILGCC